MRKPLWILLFTLFFALPVAARSAIRRSSM